MVRILGLSATLPNYVDVADFLRVNKEKAMFFFDGRFRPVPLEQTFIGMKQQPNMKQDQAMYEVLYEKLLDHVRKGYQVSQKLNFSQRN
jgi:replicative superfamily II helicase